MPCTSSVSCTTAPPVGGSAARARVPQRTVPATASTNCRRLSSIAVPHLYVCAHTTDGRGVRVPSWSATAARGSHGRGRVLSFGERALKIFEFAVFGGRRPGTCP